MLLLFIVSGMTAFKKTPIAYAEELMRRNPPEKYNGADVQRMKRLADRLFGLQEAMCSRDGHHGSSGRRRLTKRQGDPSIELREIQSDDPPVGSSQPPPGNGVDDPTQSPSRNRICLNWTYRVMESVGAGLFVYGLVLFVMHWVKIMSAVDKSDQLNHDLFNKLSSLSQLNDLVEEAKDQCAFETSCTDTVVCQWLGTLKFESPGDPAPYVGTFDVFNRNRHVEGAREANAVMGKVTVREFEQRSQPLFDVDLPDRPFCQGPHCEDLSANEDVKPPRGLVSPRYMLEWGKDNYVIVNDDDTIFIYEGASGECDVSTLMNSLTGEFFNGVEAYVDMMECQVENTGSASEAECKEKYGHTDSLPFDLDLQEKFSELSVAKKEARKQTIIRIFYLMLGIADMVSGLIIIAGCLKAQKILQQVQ